MEKLIALVLLVVATTANAEDTGRYVALTTDETVAGMVARWGTQDDRVVKWAAGFDVEIGSAEEVTNGAHLESASSLVDAVQRIIKLLATNPISGEPSRKATPLLSCVYSERDPYIVVRPLSESCDGAPRRP